MCANISVQEYKASLCRPCGIYIIQCVWEC